MVKVKKTNDTKKQIKANTTVKSGGKTIKEGLPLDHAVKQNHTGNKFGISKGITKNMGDYESLRIDCWYNDEVREGETVKQAFNRVSKLLDEVLIETAEECMKEYTE